MIGRVYTTQAGFGYFVVMARGPGFVIISPLFWLKGFTMLWKVPKSVFRDGYKPFEVRITNSYTPPIQASFDRELLKRMRWIAATGGRFGKDQSSGDVHGDGGGGS